jgi:activator of HSP90 ATPase
MKTIKQTYHIKSSIDEVWKALVDEKYINGWGGGPSKMKALVGFEFSLWGGSIWGKNIEVIPNKKLVQKWFSDEDKKWKNPSVATFNLSKDANGVKLELIHKDIPIENSQDIDDGWKDYYLGPLKDYLEHK